MKDLISLIHQSNKIVLSTHVQSDGDGLGSELALLYALKKKGKNVRIINVDAPGEKYSFLNLSSIIEIFDQKQTKLEPIDLFIIVDTNDPIMVHPLYDEILPLCKKLIYLDHHPLCKRLPNPSLESIIDTSAASTGQIVYQLIKEMEIEFDDLIAQALYTSITFDTQLYRYLKGSPVSHHIAAHLLTFDIEPDEVHRHLLATQTINKIQFLSKALGSIEYFFKQKVAFLEISNIELERYKIHFDEARDLIDTLINIKGIEIAVLIRENEKGSYKISLRSKGKYPILPVAEHLNGGGHLFAAGASKKDIEQAELKSILLQLIEEVLEEN